MELKGANITFCVLGILGFYSTWGRTIIDGTLARLLTALHDSKPFCLSGTHEPLQTHITGLYWPVDYLLNLLILFFWEAVDGSHPTTSLVGFYFAGQHLSIVVAHYVDSYRRGNAKRWVIGATLWLMIYQLTAIGTSGPWFLATYFSISPLVDPNLPMTRYRSLNVADPMRLLLLPLSTTLGYTVPFILMSLRSTTVASGSSKQFAIALWNVFPVTMAAVQIVFHKALHLLGIIEEPVKSTSSTTETEFLHAARLCYAFALATSFICHIGVATILVAIALFPMMFATEYVSAFSPHRVLIPPFSWSTVPTFGEGDLGFMQWDQFFGYACMLVFTGLTYWLAQDRLGLRVGWTGWKLTVAMIGGCLIAGPGSTVLAVQWLKDEMLFTSQVKGSTNKGKECDST